MKIVKLYPKENSKYHFGEYGLEDSSIVFHSDSLFSAILNNYAKLYGNIDDDIENIKISSLFLAYKVDEKNNIFFLPKPLPKLNFNESGQKEADKKKRKNIRKIEFISLSVLLNHNKRNVDFLEDLVIDEKFLITKEEKKEIKEKKFVFRINEEKVSIDRLKDFAMEEEGKGQLFNVEYIKLSENVYFYFLIDDSKLKKDSIKKLLAAIRLMQDEGIGGKKTSGAGFFEEVKIEDTNIFDKLNSNSSKVMSISLTIPQNQEEFNECEAYNIIERRGYIYNVTLPDKTTKRKKSVRMLSEGSIFSREIEGKTENVSPDKYNKVYRFGKFFGIPIQ